MRTSGAEALRLKDGGLNRNADNKDKSDVRAYFEEIAHALEQAAPNEDKKGKYQERRSFLSERWEKYFHDYLVRREAERADREEKYNEVISHRFPREEIDAAWQRLISGDIPLAAKKIWKSASTRTSAHDIARTANVSLREVVFWTVVFRDHHIMREDLVWNEHLYVSWYPYIFGSVGRSGPSELPEPIATLVDRLNS
jgi:hypothetical protein